MNIFNRIAPAFSRPADTSGQAQSPAQQDSEHTLKPPHRISETAEAWNITVLLPGVAKDGLELSAEEGLVTIRGRRTWQKPAGWTDLHRESVDAPFALAFAHDNLVNAEKIQAELKDGTLNLTLPKAEALKPRKISIN